MTLNAIGDAVVSADFSGRVIFTNIVAEQMSGWMESEASGRAIDDVFVLSDSATGAAVPCPTMRAIIENRIVADRGPRRSCGGGTGPAWPSKDPRRSIHDTHGGVVGAVLMVARAM